MTAHDFSTVQIAAILDELCAVVDRVRAAGQLSPAWARAFETAYSWLLVQDTVEYDHLRHALRVASASEQGRYYVANGACECKAHTAGQGVCWHRAAARLVRRALNSPEHADLQRAAAQEIAENIAVSSQADELARFAAEWDAMALRAKLSHARALRWAETEQLVGELYA